MTKTQTQTYLSTEFPQLPWVFDLVLAPKTYFKIGGPAELYLESADLKQVSQLLEFCQQQQIKVTFLGGASNVVVADEGIGGVVLHLTNQQVKKVDTVKTDGATEEAIVRIGAGTKTALAVSQTVTLGYTGLEYFLGVPGTIGGAVFNNAHYLSHLIGEHIVRVHCYNAGRDYWLSAVECQFSYDHSRFQTNHELIAEVEFRLTAGEPTTSRALIQEATVYRAQTQPLGEPSSGCIFQNAPNTPELKKRFPQFAERTHISGGFLIDQAGLKGAHRGDIAVSHKHAAFFVNKGHGTDQEVRALIDHVKTEVHRVLGVDLHEEVFYLK